MQADCRQIVTNNIQLLYQSIIIQVDTKKFLIQSQDKDKKRK